MLAIYSECFECYINVSLHNFVVHQLMSVLIYKVGLVSRWSGVSPSSSVGRIPIFCAAIGFTTLSADRVCVSWFRSTLGPRGIISPEVLHFVVLTCHLLFAAHSDLLSFTLPFSDFQLARFLVRLAGDERSLRVAISHRVGVASPAAQLHSRCWVVVF